MLNYDPPRSIGPRLPAGGGASDRTTPLLAYNVRHHLYISGHANWQQDTRTVHCLALESRHMSAYVAIHWSEAGPRQRA